MKEWITSPFGASILLHRTKIYYSNAVLFNAEKQRIFSDLKHNNYPICWLKPIFTDQFSSSLLNCSPPLPCLHFVSIQYYSGIFEKISRVLREINVKFASKPHITLKNILCKFKPKFSPL